MLHDTKTNLLNLSIRPLNTELVILPTRPGGFLVRGPVSGEGSCESHSAKTFSLKLFFRILALTTAITSRLTLTKNTHAPRR